MLKKILVGIGIILAAGMVFYSIYPTWQARENGQSPYQPSASLE